MEYSYSELKKLQMEEKLVRKYFVLVLLVAARLYGQDQPTDLRAAAGCGPARIQFNVKTDKKQHTVAQPEPGKALIYVFSEYISERGYQTIGHVTTRVGMDGNWMGASHQSSYMFFSAEPGAHRLCSDVQSMFAPKNLSAAADLSAKPGKTYYYRVVVKDTHIEPVHIVMSPMDEAEGLLMIAKSALSISQAKK